MWRSLFHSLRFRLALLVTAALLTTVAAAGVLAWALGSADVHVERVASAQRRVELLSALSGRVGEYALVALQTGETAGAGSGWLAPSAQRVRLSFDQLQAEVLEEVQRIQAPAERAVAAARTRAMAQMRARFEILDRQAQRVINRDLQATDGGREALRVALDMFAGSFGPAIGQAIEQDRAAAQSAQAAVARLTGQLRTGAAVLVLVAFVLALFLYRFGARPLLHRITEVRIGAEAIAGGRLDTRLPVSGADELSIAMDHFNEMAERLSEREARVLADQKRLQQIIEERTAELTAANLRLSNIDLARRRFFTDVSHELRTPLTVILGEAEVSLRTGAEGNDLKSALNTIRNRAQKLHRRVEDLLRIARSETGRIELDLSTAEVRAVLEEACEGSASAARSAGISIRIIEGGHDKLEVEADRDWLRQVIEGLIANAFRYAPQGSEVTLSASRKMDSVCICIVDQGVGIPQEDLPLVGERFYRGAERTGDGFGIGLALAKWVIEEHGGAMKIESSTTIGNSGTTVMLLLPMRQAQTIGEAAQ